MNNECAILIKEVLNQKPQMKIDNNSDECNFKSIRTISRYCSQFNFSIFICGGDKLSTAEYSNDVHIINTSNSFNFQTLLKMIGAKVAKSSCYE